MMVNNKEAGWRMLVVKKYSFRQTLRVFLVVINCYATVSLFKAQK